DLVPVEPSAEWVEEIKNSLGELPEMRKQRFVNDYKLSDYNANLLVSDKTAANFFEEAVKLYNNPLEIAKWQLGELQAYMKAHNLTISPPLDHPISPSQLAELVQMIEKGTISGKIAKEVLIKVLESGKSVKDVVAESGMTQMSDEGELIKTIQEVIKNNPKQVEQYKGGKTTVLAFFVGQLMKATKGRANPGLANKLLKQELDK
ncbi:MAG: Asp-tRNA(Asn)/Glu-tRNA(Gln) amidotransferase GatCAB subunit B, partial [bacterium]